MGLSPGWQLLLPDKWQARVSLLPRRTYPDMLRIFCDRQGARRSREKIQIIHIVSRPRHDRMIAAMHEHRVAVPWLQRLFAGMLSGV